MATISNTPRPGYVWDATDNVWYPIGVGGHSHSEIAKTIADAKGDLIVGTAADTVDRLAVGNNGETLVADSSTSTGLRYQGNFAAGKNKIINGDFYINQRAFTTSTTSGTYGFDRFRQSNSGGTATQSAQTFTVGTAPVAGYEGKNYVRMVTASQSAAGDYAGIVQSIEDVRSFAGQTVTVSFWAKASTGTPNVGLGTVQGFGSGGSSNVVTSAAVQAITSSWVRYSFTVAIPSISGKTVGTSSYLDIGIWTSIGTTLSGLGYPAVGVQNVTIDIWGVQAEAGSVATAFQTATGTLQGELAACQRYYWRSTPGTTYGNYGYGFGYGTTAVHASIQLPQQMRVVPASIDYSNVGAFDDPTGGMLTPTSISFQSNQNSFNIANISLNGVTGGTSYRPYFIVNNNNAAGYLGFSAEL